VTARRTTTLLLAVAMATTGTYLVIYLVRWQWNRALISGVLFVATEVLVVGRSVLHRLTALDARLAALAEQDRVRLRIVEHRPLPADRFAWLQEATTRTNVFLPLLLGAGVFASAAAWVVESVARRTAQPAMERSLVRGLTPLAFPEGGFMAPSRAVAVHRPPTAATWRRRAAAGVASVVVIGVLGIVIDAVADATQTRADVLEEGTVTMVDLEFHGARATADLERHASALVQVCASHSFNREIPQLGVVGLSSGTARVLLDADLGAHGLARLRGCLEDTTLDRIQATVLSTAELTTEDR
jgi:hypothetical protein